MNRILRPYGLTKSARFFSSFNNYNNLHNRLSIARVNTKTYVNNNHRYYCDERVEAPKIPQLMDFPQILWPSFFKFIKNIMFANFIIRPYFDNEFSLPEFVEASKHAVEVISNQLQNGNLDKLTGLLVPEAIKDLKLAISQLSLSQRQALAITKDDIFYAFPYQVGVIFDDSEDKRWVEITMCYHVLKGFNELKESGEAPPLTMGFQSEYQDNLYILNYRFIREFTKGVNDSWWVNIVNHFQPHKQTKQL